jgi:hypothetical protein
MAWTRSDKIAACSMIVALLALGYPVAKDIQAFTMAPSALIAIVDEPLDYGRNPTGQFYMDTVAVYGKASNIPADQDIWLVLRSQQQGTWRPIVRMHPDPNGVLSIHDVKLPDPGGYGIFLYLATSRSSEELQGWISRQLDGSPSSSMPSLPAEMTLLASRNIVRVV